MRVVGEMLAFFSYVFNASKVAIAARVVVISCKHTRDDIQLHYIFEA